MASGPIPSWQIDGETMKTVTDFIWGGAPKSLQMVTAKCPRDPTCADLSSLYVCHSPAFTKLQLPFIPGTHLRAFVHVVPSVQMIPLALPSNSLYGCLSFFKKKKKLTYLIVGCARSSLLLHSPFSSCSELGLFSITVCGLLIAVASLAAEHRI